MRGAMMNFLVKNILRIDGYGALITGIAFLLFNSFFSSVYNISVESLVIWSLVHLSYGLFGVLNLYFFKRKSLLKTLIVMNFVWPMICAYLVFFELANANFFLFSHLLGEGLYVFALGVFEAKFFAKISKSFNVT
jgi:hypothetical protein